MMKLVLFSLLLTITSCLAISAGPEGTVAIEVANPVGPNSAVNFQTHNNDFALLTALSSVYFSANESYVGIFDVSAIPAGYSAELRVIPKEGGSPTTHPFASGVSTHSIAMTTGDNNVQACVTSPKVMCGPWFVTNIAIMERGTFYSVDTYSSYGVVLWANRFTAAAPDWSFESWFYSGTDGHNYVHPISVASNTNKYHFIIQIGKETNTVNFYFRPSPEPRHLEAPLTLESDKWHHIAATITAAGQFEAFIDGTKFTSQSFGSIPIPTACNDCVMIMGSHAYTTISGDTTPVVSSHGLIGSDKAGYARMYSRILRDDEITNLASIGPVLTSPYTVLAEISTANANILGGTVTEEVFVYP